VWPFRRSSSPSALDLAAQELGYARAARMAAQERFLNAVKALDPDSTIVINGASHGQENQVSQIRPQGWQARRAAQGD
jgi:hypothetical protein